MQDANATLTDETVEIQMANVRAALKKAFGKKFNNIGIVHNEEGSYLIIADGDKFKHIALEDI